MCFHRFIQLHRTTSAKMMLIGCVRYTRTIFQTLLNSTAAVVNLIKLSHVCMYYYYYYGTIHLEREGRLEQHC